MSYNKRAEIKSILKERRLRRRLRKKRKFERLKTLYQCTDRESCFFRKCLWSKWFSSTPHLLSITSKIIRSTIRIPFESKFVNIGKVVTGSEKDNKIFTIIFNREMEEAGAATPMVVIHGFGSLAFDWLDFAEAIHFESKRPIYLFDTIGFNQSSRPDFFKYDVFCCPPPSNGNNVKNDDDNRNHFIPPAFSKFAPSDFLRKKNLVNKAFKAEMEFIKCVEAWRDALNLKKFILVGHSFGGYLASSYAINYPERISHLVLVDPWGFPPHPLYVKICRNVLKLPFNPFFFLRLAGPKFANKVANYLVKHVYYCNAQNPTGEEAFAIMVSGFQYARNPMFNRFHLLSQRVPVTFIYGENTWIDVTPAVNIQKTRKRTKIKIIKNAGHIAFHENPSRFNYYLLKIMRAVDKKKNDKYL
uniref:AB hydrolase-1 domain-containing protein n=1 Tax=Armadillidium vulgare clopovirus TaxID=2984284 RepID=A0A9C7BNZ1_9VIRU|nr:MAG: hypothetical protein [Armadillidium vulgare clopovirus]